MLFKKRSGHQLSFATAATVGRPRWIFFSFSKTRKHKVAKHFLPQDLHSKIDILLV